MGKILLRGLFAITPLAITIILLFWLYNHLEYIFAVPVQYFFPDLYFPGVGIILALIVLFVLGLLLNHWIIEAMYHWFEKQLKKIPLLKTIYTSITDLMGFFHTGDAKKNNQVVVVTIAGIKMLGLITREDFHGLPEGIGGEDDVTVFFPFGYQIGGFTTVVPKSMIKTVDMSVEKGLRFIATGGTSSDENGSK